MYILQHSTLSFFFFFFAIFMGLNIWKKSTRSEYCPKRVSGRTESSCRKWKQPQNSGPVPWKSCVKYYLNTYLFPFLPIRTSILHLTPTYNCSDVLIRILLVILVLQNCIVWWASGFGLWRFDLWWWIILSYPVCKGLMWNVHEALTEKVQY